MKIKLKNITAKLLILILLLNSSTPAYAKIVFDNEFLIENNGNAWVIDSRDDVVGNIALQFGNTVGESITFDTTNSEFNFSNNLSLGQNQLKDVAIENLASAPATPVVGQVYYNTTSNRAYLWNGTAWIDITASAGSIPDFEGVYASDADGTLTTTNGDVTINTGTGDLIVNSNDWSVDALGNVTTNNLNSGGIVDFSGATRMAIAQGASNPITCTEGDQFYNTTDNYLYLCTVTDTWTTVGTTDANTLDTLDSTQFLRSDANDNFTIGTLTLDSGTTLAVNGIANLGDGGDAININSSTWNISGAGAASGFTTFDASGNITITGGDVIIGTTGLSETTAANDSGAFKIGTFNEFDNSASVNVQDVLDDLDFTISNIDGSNSNSFILDKDNTGGDVSLQFGAALGEAIKWDSLNAQFDISDDLNFNQNQLKNIVIDQLASAPITPAIGQIYYNTTLGKVYIWNGTVWQDLVAEPHAASHIDGSDDIDLATATTKGLMSPTQFQDLADLKVQGDEINRNTIDVQLTLGENVAGSIAYLTYDNPNGTDFVANIENTEYIINDSPTIGIPLTGGSDINPVLNYVYVRESGITAFVESSTTDPANQAFNYVPIGEVMVGAVGVTATYYYVENLTNYIRNFIGDTNNRLRVTGVIWLSGITLTTTGLDIATTQGTVIHMHEEVTYPAKNTTVDTITDAFYNTYAQIDNVNYDNGAGGNIAIGNNKYHKVFIWGDIYGGLHMERQQKPPTSEYTSIAAAEVDADDVAVSAIPSEWGTVGFPIAHLILQSSTPAVLKMIDLRGGSADGGTVSGGHTQNTDTGTSENTFTLNQNNTTGNINLIFGAALNESLMWNDINNDFDLSNDLNLNQNELRNAAIQNLANAPATPIAGQIYRNTTNGNTYIYNEITWEDLTIDDFEKLYASDVDNTLTTSDGLFAINTGINDFMVTSNDWSVDALGNITTTSGDVIIGTTGLSETTAANDSGAFKIGVFDEFDNSISTNTQGVLNDLDFTISNLTGTNSNTLTLDKDDTGGNVALQFGTTLTETLLWDNINTRFTLSDDARVEGNLAVIGQTYLATNHAVTDSNGILNMGRNAAAWESFQWNDINDQFEISDDLSFGQAQIKNVAIENLAIAPTAPIAGQIYHNITDNNTYIWSGSAWDEITAGAGTTPTFEDIYGADADKVLTTSNGAFTVSTGTNDFVVTSSDWSVDALGNLIVGGNTTLGVGVTNTVSINTTSWNVSSVGIASGLTGIASIGSIDFTAAATFGIPQAIADPATCSEGQQYYNTATNELRLCTAINTWSSVGSTTGANYAFSYDTTTQAISAANTYQDIIFNTNGTINGWTHADGTADFIAGASGLYLVTVEGTASKSDAGSDNFEMRTLFNGVEVAGSQSGIDMEIKNIDFHLSSTFLVNATAGQILKIQATSSTNKASINPGGANAITQPSAKITIMRIN